MRALAVLLAAALGLAGCGGDDGSDGGAGDRTALPYPPKAAEPASSPEPSEEPAGRVVEVGNLPEGVAFDPRSGLVAVGVREPDQLALVDGRTGEVRERVRLPGAPRHLALARPGGPVLVPAEDADVLVEVSLPDGATRVTEVGDNPHDVAFADGRSYVGDEFGGTLSVVQEGKLVRQVPVDVQPGGVVAAGERIVMISVRAYTVEPYEIGDLQGEGSQNAGRGPTHGVADDQRRIYVADTRGDAVLVYETEPRLRFVGRLELPGSPYGIAVDRRRDRVWVTLTARNEVVELSTGAQPRELRRLPTVRQPNTLAVDEQTGRLFIAGRTGGVLQIVDP